MSSRSVTVIKIAVIGALAFVLSGCSTVSFGSVFHRDGTATHSVTIMFQRGGLVEADARRLERQLEAVVERAEGDGYRAERVSTMTQTGVRVSSTTREVLDTGAALNSLYNSIVRESSGPIAPFVGGFDRESTAIGGGQFNFELTVNGDVLYRSIQDVSPGHRQLSTRDGVDEVVNFAYSVSMPGQVRDTNGSLSGRSMVRWEIPLEDSTTMVARSSLVEDSPWLLIILTILGSLVVVVAVSTTVAWVLIYRRNRLSPGIVHPVAGASSQFSGAASPETSLTVQDVSSSLARVVDRVMSGHDASLDDEGQASGELADGIQPQRD